MSETRCTVCGDWFPTEVVHGCGGTPTFNPLDPLNASCEIESLRNKLNTALLQVRELQKGMLDIVGTLQGSRIDESSFREVYRIANGFIEKRNDEVGQRVEQGCHKCGAGPGRLHAMNCRA